MTKLEKVKWTEELIVNTIQKIGEQEFKDKLTLAFGEDEANKKIKKFQDKMDINGKSLEKYDKSLKAWMKIFGEVIGTQPTGGFNIAHVPRDLVSKLSPNEVYKTIKNDYLKVPDPKKNPEEDKGKKGSIVIGTEIITCDKYEHDLLEGDSVNPENKNKILDLPFYFRKEF